MTPKITDKALSGTGLIVLSTALACALSDASESPSGGGVKNMVINPQSYPTVGGNRAVLFNTTGAADLWITAVDGTTWTDQPYECYDEKTEVLTDKGWKLFNNLNDERVLTLNSDTGKAEWQTPAAKQTYDYNGRMYRVLLEDGYDLLASPEHKVYAGINDQDLVGVIVMNEPVKNYSILFQFEKQDETSCVHPLVLALRPLEVLKVFDSGFIQRSDLIDLPLNLSEQHRILLFERYQGSFKFIGGENFHSHNSSHHLLNSSEVIGFTLPDLRSSEVLSMELTTSLIRDSLTSLLSSGEISDISAASSINSTSSMNFNLSENAFLATEDQLTQSTWDILFFNSSGTSTTISAINNNYKRNYLNKNSVSLLKISGISTDKRVFFLNRNLEPVKVERIEKVPCTGEIYDVTVSNHIILIKRNGTPVWSGNSNTENHDLKFIEIKCGDNILNYEWINNPILIRNYECSETGTGKVLTSGKHYIEFKFSLQTYNPNIYYTVKNND